jgi:hypothetical protein
MTAESKTNTNIKEWDKKYRTIQKAGFQWGEKENVRFDSFSCFYKT